jgi:tetratricopeptide (TPR) repeat protein
MRSEHVINITYDKKNVLLEIDGLYLFQGYQVMEAFTMQEDECYYLFFYKNKFLTGKRTTKIKRKSTLNQVITKGIFIPSPHPIIQSLLANNSTQTFPTLNTTWKNLNKVYNKVESAHILTVFDCYLKKDKVISLLKKICLQFRRDGKFLQAFRILQLMVDKYPTNKWAQSLITHIDYQKYSLYYQSEIETLLHYDPLYSEKQLYLQIGNGKAFDLLQEKLRSEFRNLECLALYCHQLSSDPNNFDQYFHQLLETLSTNFSEIKSISILYTIYNHPIPMANKEKVQKQLLSQLITVKQYEDAFDLLTQNKKQLSASQIDILIIALNNLDPSYPISLEDFKVQNLINADINQLEQLMATLIPRLFEKYDISYVYPWLKPLFHLPMAYIEIIKTMYNIREEPDQQHFMGELYYQLNLLPQAIDCFLWDVELNPTNPHPIKWLTKLYRESGMEEESKSYYYLYKQVQKSS